MFTIVRNKSPRAKRDFSFVTSRHEPVMHKQMFRQMKETLR